MSLKPAIYIYIDPKIEENMPEADEHATLGHYLLGLMRYQFRDRNWFVSYNLQILQRTPALQRDIDPDLAVFQEVSKPVATTNLTSWRMGEVNRPAPAWVFEIASASTWAKDIDTKIDEYRLLGAQEYFTYDPNDPPYWGHNNQRLRGWRYNANREAQLLSADERGWFWCESLQVWLEPAGKLLYLRDSSGQRLLTEAEEKAEALKLERLAREKALKLERQAREKAEQELKELQARLRQLENKDN
jgi:Uma2 family endonuclease